MAVGREPWQEGIVKKQIVVNLLKYALVAYLAIRRIARNPVVNTLLKYGLGIGLLGWVVWRYWDSTPERPGLAEALQQPIQVGPLLLAAAAYLVGVIITLYRWYVLVRA